MIEEGDFDDVLPEECRKLGPKAELEEFLNKNKVVVFISKDDSVASSQLLTHFETLSVTHSRVEVAVNEDFARTLAENAEHFAYAGHQVTQVYIEGRNAGTAA